MILIATDEAGYGPKLGPLVVTASAWRLPDSPSANPAGETEAKGSEASLEGLFERLKEPYSFDGVSVAVDDSKAVFQPRSRSRNAKPDLERPPYFILQLVAAAGLGWIGASPADANLGALIAKTDHGDLERSKWLSQFVHQTLPQTGVGDLINHWKPGDARLVALKSRVITAERFNGFCKTGWNKSDILSSVTLQLVRSLLTDVQAEPGPRSVRCDRHGGRRYYAGPIQSVFPDSLAQVISESKTESIYRVPEGTDGFEIRFTVKGDRFPPVAYSSMVAKFLREKAMESFNEYFLKQSGCPDNLKPTAGYPQDADRYLKDIKPILTAGAIDTETLIRER
ncbi:MAG: hypothetical protein AAFV88_03235 [Planctomycetota bacterium]